MEKFIEVAAAFLRQISKLGVGIGPASSRNNISHDRVAWLLPILGKSGGMTTDSLKKTRNPEFRIVANFL